MDTTDVHKTKNMQCKGELCVLIIGHNHYAVDRNEKRCTVNYPLKKKRMTLCLFCMPPAKQFCQGSKNIRMTAPSASPG